MLRKVASVVEPIMRRRRWRVGILGEFYPAMEGLVGMNWNHGAKICLRLREAFDERQFLPIEDIVETMLHELAHILHPDHDAAFDALNNQLLIEHEQLLPQLNTDQLFVSTGHRRQGEGIPRHEGLRSSHVAPTAQSGSRLGGIPDPSQDGRKAAADAATRRSNAANGCPTGSELGREIVEETTRTGTITNAEENSADEEAIMLAMAYMDLIQEEEKERYGASSPGGLAGESRDGLWLCNICTLINPSGYGCCDACGNARSRSRG